MSNRGRCRTTSFDNPHDAVRESGTYGGRRQSRWHRAADGFAVLSGTLCRRDYSRVRKGGQLVATPPELLVAHGCFCGSGVRTGMLESLSDQVRKCLRHAEDCLQRAASQTDPKLRRDFLIIAACWLKLSHELSELPANFSNERTDLLH